MNGSIAAIILIGAAFVMGIIIGMALNAPFMDETTKHSNEDNNGDDFGF